MPRWSDVPVLRRVEPFVVAILTAVAVAALLPAGGGVATGLSWGTTVGVGVLFFVYGARMAPAEAVAGLRNWRLQGAVAATTYVVFPLLGLLLSLLVGRFLDDGLVAGVLFLAALPSTVQSCVVFTAMAHGNVPGAVVSATVSNLAGIGVTPLLAALLLGSAGAGPDGGAVGRILLQLLVPFLVGLLAGRWIGPWVRAHRGPLTLLDRAVIVGVVYAAFSRGVRQGVWREVGVGEVAVVLGCAAVFLAAVLALAWWVPRLWGAGRADRVTIAFCGSNKSLATGLPMATVLFDPHVVGLVALPVILYHPLQITVCSVLATRLGRAPLLQG
ncbi:bile acid:sodium symporter family protein [Kineococcus rhizosphaerae]|uniref:bile acid:sodium symporter family protein n=1 Tax=Kineococcus rhizosphaerae TaxID=559628 RepID=UPI000D069B2F|nr:bile acid:sodium symporter family protein [Kineococcus rhizosphaerae]